MPGLTPKPAKNPPARNPIDRRRRRHQRYQDNFRITVTHLSADSYETLEGHCRDLSEAGIGILLAAELKVGDVTGLVFSLPKSGVRWEVRAVVRYRRGYHYGFEFLALPGPQQELLKTYLVGLKPLD